MKKKLLSLVLAGTMVASTSVSAFADGMEYEVQPKGETTAEVDIRGDVESDNGETLAESITVTIPTNASFKVDKDGTLTSGTMKIENKGNKTVSLIASSFEDANGTKGINLVRNQDDLADDDRSKVYLKLTGGKEDVILTSEGGGKMYKGVSGDEINSTDGFVIKEIGANSVANLQLQGKGTRYISGTNKAEAVGENFRLVLKIKQERQ